MCITARVKIFTNAYGQARVSLTVKNAFLMPSKVAQEKVHSFVTFIY